LAVVAGMKKLNDHAEPTKSQRLKKISITDLNYYNHIRIIIISD